MTADTFVGEEKMGKQGRRPKKTGGVSKKKGETRLCTAKKNRGNAVIKGNAPPKKGSEESDRAFV